MAGNITAGMDIGQVRTLANQMNQAADEILQVATRLTTQLQNTPWLGPDRTKFEQSWQTGRNQLQQLTQMLKTEATVLTANANDQEATSNR